MRPLAAICVRNKEAVRGSEVRNICSSNRSLGAVEYWRAVFTEFVGVGAFLRGFRCEDEDTLPGEAKYGERSGFIGRGVDGGSETASKGKQQRSQVSKMQFLLVGGRWSRCRRLTALEMLGLVSATYGRRRYHQSGTTYSVEHKDWRTWNRPTACMYSHGLTRRTRYIKALFSKHATRST